MSRYIDVEELKHITNNSSYYGTPELRAFLDMVADTPTADVVPRARYKQLLENSTIMADALKEYENEDVREVMRGEWISHMVNLIYPIEDDRKQVSWFECSECKYGVSWRANFCPNCGADMRKE